MDNKTILSTFVESYNLLSPTKIELMELAGFDLATALSLALYFKISFIENNYSEKEGLEVNFMNCVVPVMGNSGLAIPFSFTKNILDNQNMPNYFYIGYWGDDLVFVDKKTNEVITYNDDAQNISHFLAPSFKDFLAILLIMAEDGRISFLNLLQKPKQYWKDKIYAIIHSDKYFDFYETFYS